MYGKIFVGEMVFWFGVDIRNSWEGKGQREKIEYDWWGFIWVSANTGICLNFKISEDIDELCGPDIVLCVS